MGWLLKAGAVVVALMLFPVGGWVVSVLLLLYAFSGLISRALRVRPRRVAPPNAGPAGHVPAPERFVGYSGHRNLRLLGLVFLVLSTIALADRGTYAPLVFGAIGVSLVLWGMPVRIGSVGALRPVGGSILLRGTIPFRWFAVAEVKLSTKSAGRALGGVDERLLIDKVGEGWRVHVVVGTTSLTRRAAEQSIFARLGELAAVSAPLGGYVLPLDAVEGAAILARPREVAKLEARGWPSALSTVDWDLLVVDSERGGFVKSVGAYKDGRGGLERPTIPPCRQTLSRPSLLWEVFQELGKKVEWEKPDGLTAFLASMFATEGEAIGERIADAGDSGSSQQVLIHSVGTAPVRLSRAQLRAIVSVYA